jgi:site-specific recombinase XerD
MSIRPHPSKDGWHIIDVGRGKARQRVPFEGTLDAARIWESDLRRSLGPPAECLISPKFNQCLPDFIDAYKNNHLPKGTARTMISLTHLARFLGNLTLPGITDTIIEQYKTHRLQAGVSRSTIQKELCALSSVFKWAKKKRFITHAPLIEKFPGYLIEAPIPMIPARGDIERIIAAVLEPWKRVAFHLMLFCGLRRSEALNLKGVDIIPGRNLILVTGKRNKQRLVPVVRADIWAHLLARKKETGEGYIWLNPDTGRPYIDIMDSLKNAALRLGFQGRVYNHLLRHCFCTYSNEAGMSTRDIQVVAGHSTSQVTEKYTHPSSPHLTAGMDRWQNPDTQRVTKKPRKPATPKH